MRYETQVAEIIRWAHLLNARGYVAGRGGNISYRAGESKMLITSHDCYLGFLEEKDISCVDINRPCADNEKDISSEKLLHGEIQKKLIDIKVVIHAHPAHTTAFFAYFSTLEMFSFEVRFYLGNVKVVPQETPTVTRIAPVMTALENNNIVVLKNHGVVAVGKDFKEAFSLIELLEEQAKVNLLVKDKLQPANCKLPINPQSQVSYDDSCKDLRKFTLLSEEHIQRLVELINNDKEAQELGSRYDLTCTLAIKNQDAGRAVCFYYDKGKIVRTDSCEDAEFVIIGREDILKKVFNREIDPFVASTQGKVKTKGDFAKMSRWYPVLVRTFKLWEKAPVL